MVLTRNSDRHLVIHSPYFFTKVAMSWERMAIRFFIEEMVVAASTAWYLVQYGVGSIAPK